MLGKAALRTFIERPEGGNPIEVLKMLDKSMIFFF